MPVAFESFLTAPSSATSSSISWWLARGFFKSSSSSVTVVFDLVLRRRLSRCVAEPAPVLAREMADDRRLRTDSASDDSVPDNRLSCFWSWTTWILAVERTHNNTLDCNDFNCWKTALYKVNGIVGKINRKKGQTLICTTERNSSRIWWLWIGEHGSKVGW